MPALTAVYLDLHCLYSLRAWRWLVALGSSHAPGPAVDARPYWRSAGGRAQPWDAEGPSWTLDVLALGELAREQGRRAHHDYIGIALHAVHTEKLDAGTPGGLEALASRASLDLAAFTAERERWRAEVGLHHREAEDDFGVFETPTLVFDDDRAVLVRLVDDVQVPSAARALLDHVAGLAGRHIPELRRTPDRSAAGATMREDTLSPSPRGRCGHRSPRSPGRVRRPARRGKGVPLTSTPSGGG